MSARSARIWDSQRARYRQLWTPFSAQFVAWVEQVRRTPTERVDGYMTECRIGDLRSVGAASRLRSVADNGACELTVWPIQRTVGVAQRDAGPLSKLSVDADNVTAGRHTLQRGTIRQPHLGRRDVHEASNLVRRGLASSQWFADGADDSLRSDPAPRFAPGPRRPYRLPAGSVR